MEQKKDNYFNQINIEIDDNVMKYGNEAIQISNISQIRVSKEPPKTYPIVSIIGLCICILALFTVSVVIPLWVIGIVIFGIKLLSIALYNSMLKTYLIVEMNSGRTSLFSARDENFLVTAKNSLMESFNQKSAKLIVDFSECTIKGCVFGDNNTVINTEVQNEANKSI